MPQAWHETPIFVKAFMRHYTSAGDLDERGTGDVWTMTVQEYLEASRWEKFAYRLAHRK